MKKVSQAFRKVEGGGGGGELLGGSNQSAYDMKNIFCLFERPLKIQKNAVFLFETSFFRVRNIDDVP